MYMGIQTDTLELLGIAVAKGYVEPMKLTAEQSRIVKNTEEVMRNYRVSTRMQKYRRKNKITQKEMGIKIGVKQNNVSHYENRRSIIPVQLYPCIADALGVTVDELLKEE